MATNLLKRLESSVNSFRLTLTRISEYIRETIRVIDDYDDKHGSASVDAFGMVAESDFEYGDTDPFATKKSKISLADMDYVSWRRDLSADLECLELLLLMLKDITPMHDSKLQMLLADLKDKFEHPINGDNKKVLIFTAFADTANYLYEQLAGTIKNDCGLNSALITGSTEGRCTISKFPMSFNNILTYFSPLSKDRAAIFPEAKEEIDILIATDCISEGQNLQDCDYLINYDIHWNPVRIIQRFGRIDRIGSKNKQIQLVNYWPDMELDDYIQLKGRVESRMKATILTAAGTGNPLSIGEEADLEYRLGQLKKLQNEVMDIEDMDTGINIMDLGLNEFRLDLLGYLKEHPDIEHAPFGLNAVVGSSSLAKPGVMFVLKNRNNSVNIDHKNLLHPFYMVYLSDDGEVLCDHLHPKQLLDIMRAVCRDRTVECHCHTIGVHVEEVVTSGSSCSGGIVAVVECLRIVEVNVIESELLHVDLTTLTGLWLTTEHKHCVRTLPLLTICSAVEGVLANTANHLCTESVSHVLRTGGESESLTCDVVAVEVVCLSTLKIESLSLCIVGVGDEVEQCRTDRSGIVLCCQSECVGTACTILCHQFRVTQQDRLTRLTIRT